jgi:arylsulfatase A-like enzyme
LKYIKFLLVLLPLISNGQKQETQPNILLIISDDQGYGDFGFTGNKIVNTPNLDRLSEEAAFYPHFLVGPACTPTRSALMTGRNHLDTGVWGVGSRGKVRRDETMMPKFFNPSGYHTWAFGKMDGGLNMMEMNPNDRGFDTFDADGGGGKCTSPFPGYCHKRENGWVAELITDAAIEKIKSADDKPWLMLMAYIIPHLPWHCPETYAEPYRKKGYSEDLAQCYGSIKQMDDQIGRLLNVLNDTGQAENTIVIFMSDNGSLDAMGNREMGVWENVENKRPHSKDWIYRNPDGLIGRKGEVWDNGIRSPLLVRWPEKIQPGIRKHAVGVEDVLPTLLDVAQIPQPMYPAHLPFAGKSFVASLEDSKFSDDRDIFRLASGGPGTPSGVKGKVVEVNTTSYHTLHTILRSGKYKFHHLPGGEFRLYDMEKDAGEVNDLSKKYAERTAAMANRCRTQWDNIASRDRTFPMRQLKIDNADRSRKVWKIPVIQPLGLTGKMISPDFGSGLIGFRSPGDCANYTIEVEKPLTVSFVVEGKGFDQCAPISLRVDGKPVAVKSRSADKIVFGSAELPAGTVPLSLVVDDDAERGAAIGEVINLTLKEQEI